jgi:integrase
MVPRKVTVNGDQTRWEVRIDKALRKQEGGIRKYFPRLAEAQGYCNRLQAELRNYSDKARGLTDAQKIEAQDAFDRLATMQGAKLPDAIEYYLAHLAVRNRSKTLKELGDYLVAERRTNGGRGAGDRTLDEIEERWGRFAKAFPGRLASTITSEEVHGWLMGLTTPDGKPVSLQTRRGYRRVLHLVFEYAGSRVRRWVENNPVADVELPTSVRQRVALLSPDQTATLLGAAVPEMRPYFAICAFAGARPDQAKGITWEQIHLDRKEIEIPAGTDKTDRERIVPIQPNLAAWLEQVPASARTGRIFYSRSWFERAVEDAKIGRWEQDCLRHGYCYLSPENHGQLRDGGRRGRQFREGDQGTLLSQHLEDRGGRVLRPDAPCPASRLRIFAAAQPMEHGARPRSAYSARWRSLRALRLVCGVHFDQYRRVAAFSHLEAKTVQRQIIPSRVPRRISEFEGMARFSPRDNIHQVERRHLRS